MKIDPSKAIYLADEVRCALSENIKHEIEALEVMIGLNAPRYSDFFLRPIRSLNQLTHGKFNTNGNDTVHNHPRPLT
jgi:hypothetical protein